MKKLLIGLTLLFFSTTVSAWEDVELELNLLGYTAGLFGVAQIKEQDKQMHALAGAVLGTWGTVFSDNPWVGVASAGIAGGLKEAYDRRTEGHVADWADFGYTLGAGIYFAYFTGQVIKQYEDTPLVSFTDNKHSNIVMYQGTNNQPLFGFYKRHRWFQ